MRTLGEEPIRPKTEHTEALNPVINMEDRLRMSVGAAAFYKANLLVDQKFGHEKAAADEEARQVLAKNKIKSSGFTAE